ncbi:MAG: hypothetical protein A3H98_13395 [Bacteroidetes bacterium RIFCSPLOWO2_02_FULL_36_8]|nr:MAG: hypothetical protein A3H98_13395 [Bacteroidetes bacterium RIFCSPLOWO2_02_FULL_36_8]OFY70181.1 MAG: hypothetical protein A3G23_08510 [Bacteroidetes bacterium RIFCSPLOWO2_12_FULL_37_12]
MKTPPPSVVFLHGFCETKKIWNFFLESLSPHFNAIALDLPGFGDNTISVKGISIEKMAENVHKQLTELNVNECVMVGHSLGGYVSLAYAEKYPDFLAGLCLFHSSPFADTPEKITNRNRAIKLVEERGVSALTQTLMPSLFSANSLSRLKNTISEYAHTASLTNKETVIEVSKAMRDRKNRREVLMRFQKPFMLIAGKDDPVIPQEVSTALCMLTPQCSAHFLNGVGHNGMLEAPELTLRFMRDFLERVYA